jgi:23S rRNA pseudouridine1911/1915/1917 synthase
MQVLYEDNHIIIVHKESGEIVQGDKTGDIPLSETVKDWIKKEHNKPMNVFLGVVHRLDRPAQGIVVFAKTSKALARLNKMFASQEIKKTYWVITENLPRECEISAENFITLHNWLVRNEKQNKSYIAKSGAKDAKQAVLSYRTLVRGEHYVLLEINLETGRHHQIRCQLAAIGCPVKGDLKYGARRSNPDGGISLHARQIEFIHPVSKQNICISAPVPEESLWQQFAALVQ